MPTITYKEPAAQTPNQFPQQKQVRQPGDTGMMNPVPVTDNAKYVGSGKLKDRAAIITGGDSGIGQAAAIAFAKEGADVAIVYLDNNDDAAATKKAVEDYGRRCFSYALDLKSEQSAYEAVKRTIIDLGKIDVLVNNIAVQYPQNSIEDILAEQLVLTFETNIFSYFYMIKACLPNLKPGASIINTASITAYKGSETLIDYSATKGAVVSMTRSLSMSLVKRGIRVNAVAPGPVWTPLITSSFSPQEVEKFGQDTPMGRAAQPFELAPTYVYLACDDSAYVSGQVLHVNGGIVTES
jgi:NAD(P)-dependent dehydrogenase (short-subunit alcohol dehydrogenase family)